MKSILDRSFRYTPSAATDVRKTFARIRRRMEAEKRQAALQAQQQAPAEGKVARLTKRRAA